jgi:putative AdoMet-dependent methyltransferase
MDDTKPTNPSWQYDENIQLGRDFSKREIVEAYDIYHRKFRDIDGENQAIIKELNLQSSDMIADIGCGTGAFVRQAARHCSRVYAVDISPEMLDYTGWKASQEGLTNITCCQGGFLTYEHSGPPLDAVTSSMALHHIPDFWKQKALCRVNHLLKDGGKFYLADVVFDEVDYEANIDRWIERLTQQAGPDIAKDMRRHLQKEHSTFTWILEGLLTRAGFRIDKADHLFGALSKYYCTKIR